MTPAPDGWQFPEVTDATVERYRRNYALGEDCQVTGEMVRHHMELEYQLTQRLLRSDPGSRTKVWAECYDQLYRGVPWLADNTAASNTSPALLYGHLLKLIPPCSKVIEIGSGAGTLAAYLTENGRRCIATEITSARGVRDSGNVVWHHTDGVHLADFEPRAGFDVVISMQVLEHLHPDDIQEHLANALALLKPGGRYILTTPHAFLGPADLSLVFEFDRPRFMHLKEYTHRELGAVARRAGFSKVAAAYTPPMPIRRRLDFLLCSRALFVYLSTMELILQRVRIPRVLLHGLLFRGDVFLVLTR